MHASDTQGVVVITQMQPIAVVFTAPEEKLSRFRAALRSGPLPVTALTSDGRTELDEGTVSLIDNQIDTTSGSVRLKAKFDNKELKLWPGLTVATRLPIYTLRDVVVIPEKAVRRGPNDLFAYVLSGVEGAQVAPLRTEVSDDGQVAIQEGIRAGERVITSGFDQLRPGALVDVHQVQAQNAPAKGTPRLNSEHKTGEEALEFP